jgi:hypothetical protein
MAWTNDDGLTIKFGTERGQVKNSGWNMTSQIKTLTHKFTYEDIADTDTAAVDVANTACIPAGSVIKSATLYVTTAFAGATAVLDIGLKVAAGTNTDDDGIDAAIAVTALDAVGDVIQCDGAYVMEQTGNLTGIRLTADQYIMTTYDTAAFTAGAATLVVEYIEVED